MKARSKQGKRNRCIDGAESKDIIEQDGTDDNRHSVLNFYSPCAPLCFSHIRTSSMHLLYQYLDTSYPMTNYNLHAISYLQWCASALQHRALPPPLFRLSGIERDKERDRKERERERELQRERHIYRDIERRIDRGIYPYREGERGIYKCKSGDRETKWQRVSWIEGGVYEWAVQWSA